MTGLACQTSSAARDWDRDFVRLCANDGDLQHFHERRGELEAQRNDLNRIYGSTHRSVQRASAEIDVCDDFIATRRNQIAETLGPRP
jgi:uncharacterized protein involved in exopolysaccharide biosynthesis